MATYRPKIGFSAWDAPATPLKTKWDWPKIAVWSGLLLFCIGVWAVIIFACGRLV